MIGLRLEYEVMNVVLALNRRRIIAEELDQKYKMTGLYPFMSGVIPLQCRLTDVFMMRKEFLNGLAKRMKRGHCCKK